MATTTIKINLEKYKIDAEGILVVDMVEKTAPAKGGIRVHQNVTEEEIASLAAEMTQKCILAGLPFGGAKGGIRLSDLRMVERAMYAFGRELSKLDFLPYKWCAAPDVNTDSKAIDAFIAGCASVKGWRKSRMAATGKSSGIPHELGSTAYGVVLSLERLIQFLDLPYTLKKMSAIVEGLGEVGGNTVRFLVEKGVQIMGVSDITGALYNMKGLDEEKLCDALDKKTPVSEMSITFPHADYQSDSSALLERDADILILAGPGRSIIKNNLNKLKVKIIVEGANIAYSDEETKKIVSSKGIISIPGIIANSGGVISSYEEWMLENEELVGLPGNEKWNRVKASIERRITRNIEDLCGRLKREPEKSTHECALDMVAERLLQSKEANRKLRYQTKYINSELEDKFEVFTH